MKILKVTSSYYPAVQFGGSVSGDLLFDENLINEGINIEVVSTNAGLLENKNIPLKTWTKCKGIPIIYFPFLGYQHYNFSFSYLWFLIRNIKKYDIIHFSGIWNFPVCFGAFLARFFRKPFIITTHGTLFQNAFNTKSQLFKKIHYFLLVKKNLVKANFVHFTSETEKNETFKFLKLQLKSVVVPYGLSLEEEKNNDINKFKAKYNLFPDEKIILFLGRISWIKGLDLLIQAFNQICLKQTNIKLFLVGPDTENYQEKLINLIEPEFRNRVTFPGMLEGKDKVLAYKAADLFILPSYSENFGMTVIEALKYKTPVIVSDKVGLASEIQNANAGIVIPHNKEEFVEKILFLLNNKELQEKLTNNGYNLFTNKFIINCVIDKFINIYKEIIEKR